MCTKRPYGCVRARSCADDDVGKSINFPVNSAPGRPPQLSDDALTAVVDAAVAEVASQPGVRAMGQVMKAANAKVAGRADGGRVAALVKARLNP